jgi:hypothetical protein
MLLVIWSAARIAALDLFSWTTRAGESKTTQSGEAAPHSKRKKNQSGDPAPHSEGFAGIMQAWFSPMAPRRTDGPDNGARKDG